MSILTERIPFHNIAAKRLSANIAPRVKIYSAPVQFLDKGRGVCYTLAQLNKNYCHRVVGYGHSYAHR